MNGVEFARADANVVYLALRSPDGASRLGRSSDGGAHFVFRDVSAALGPGMLRIIAIDPQDANRVLFRFLGANDQSIALTVDGGMTVTKPLTVNGFFNSFTRLDNGTILVSGMVQFSSVPGLFRSRDRGTTFEEVPRPPSIRALSQRNGTVYAATDNFGDGYALGTSVDEGTTWRAMMSYADVKAINPCLKAQCQATCDAEVMLSLWPAEVCAADPPPGSTGTGGGGGAGRAGRSGAVGSAAAARAARRRRRKKAAATSRRRRAHRRWASGCSGCCSSRPGGAERLGKRRGRLAPVPERGRGRHVRSNPLNVRAERLWNRLTTSLTAHAARGGSPGRLGRSRGCQGPARNRACAIAIRWTNTWLRDQHLREARPRRRP